MKIVTRWFILMQTLDIATSTIGWMMGVDEGNPFGNPIDLLVFKVIVIVCVGIILQIKKTRKIDAVIPILSGIVVPWNILNIVLR